MKIYSVPGLARSLFVPALLSSAVVLPSVSVVRAATITWDGNGTGASALDVAVNWVGDALPTTSSEVLFDNSVITAGGYPSSLSLDTTTTWGSLVWNTNQGVNIGVTGGLSSRSLTFSAGSGFPSAVSSGGASGDLILLGSAMTSGTVTLGGRIGAGTNSLSIVLPTGSYNIDVVNAGATLAFGQVSGASGATITKTGAGTVTFNNGNNNALGGSAKFILAGGTLNFGNNAGFGGNATTILEIQGGTFLDNSSGAAVDMSAKSYLQTWSGDFTYKGSGGFNLNLGTGAVTMSGGSRVITVNASSLTVGGVIDDGVDTYGLTKAGAGGLNLGGVNTYGGATIISGGTLSTNVANALPGTTEVIISSGTSTSDSGILNINGQNQTVEKLSSSVTGAGTTKGVVMNNGATSTATLTVTGTSTFDGTLKNGTSGATTRILALAKSTGGTLRLTGTASTYTGGTTVTGGTLLANNASGSATGTGAITVNGGFFGGTGTASGAITINAGGAITPGDGGAGTFTGGSSLTWNSDNTLAGMTFDLGVNQAASDQLVLTGAFTKGTGSAFVFNFTDAGYTPSFAYTLVTFGSTTFVAGDFSATGAAGNFAIVGNSLQFTLSAVPEPSTYAAIFGALALGVTVIVRRRRA